MQIVKIVVYALYFVFLGSNLYSDTLKKDSYAFLTNAIEAYINNKPIPPLKSRIILFDCERNYSYHQGYKSTNIGIVLNEYPYIKVEKVHIPDLAYVINLSVDTRRMDLIVNFRINNKWYGTLLKLKKDGNEYKIRDVPDELLEND